MSRSNRGTREVLVGIDVGTTNLRAAVYDTSARLVSLAVRAAADARAVGELHPETLWRHTVSAISEALAAARATGVLTVRGIAVAGVGCVPVFLDHAGAAFGLAADEDRRTQGLASLASLASAAEFRARTGYPFDTTTVACRLAGAPPEQKARIAAVMSVSGFIGYRLSGVLAHDRSTAASMALWDASRAAWWTQLIEAIGLDPAIFGDVVDSALPLGPVAGDLADRLGLDDETVVSTGGHDYLAAALAAGVGPGGGILDVAGTLEVVATIHDGSDAPIDDPSVRAMRDHHVVPGQRSYMVEAFAGSAIERLRAAAGFDAAAGSGDPLAAAFAELDAAAAVGDASLAAKAATVSGPASELQSVIEELCIQARVMVAHQLDVLGAHRADVTVVGGGSRSLAWNRIKADVLGIPIRVPRIREATALGAALLAGVGAGVYRDLGDAAGVGPALGADVVEPRRPRA
jgi:xylulokinase